jgi:diaminohydroxyphosphoribosylaminopyrimidine deaminase/5-amino-6-(5-phosphoribosylamino)uracil reductase
VAEADSHFMKLALREAIKGSGRTSPNPLVGAVVVKNGEVVGRGWHKKAGTPHAEIHALRAAGSQAGGATIYVTLEPCNHTGRTPPCTQAILQSGINRVVIGMIDPNPHVTGSGRDFLAAQGIEVSSGVLADECRAINRTFIKHITTGLPWVIMKAGCSMDGRLAVSSGQCAWITNEQSRKQVHLLRDRCDAILVGIGTALNDNPSLTTRLSNRKGHDPLRVIIDTRLRLPVKAKMLNQESSAATWIFCGPDPESDKVKALEAAGARVVPVGEDMGRVALDEVLAFLGREQVNSLLVEGGSLIHTAFLQAGLIDQVNLFLAPVFLGSDAVPLIAELGLEQVRDSRRFSLIRTRRFADDIMIEGVFN